MPSCFQYEGGPYVTLPRHADRGDLGFRENPRSFQHQLSTYEKSIWGVPGGKTGPDCRSRPVDHRFKVLKCPPKRKSEAIAPLNRDHQCIRLQLPLPIHN